MRIVVLMALFGVGQAFAQQVKPPVPAFTFRLQAGKVPGWRSEHGFLSITAPPLPVIAATADHRTLLALIPQQDRRWELQRLTDWQTGTPHVERLGLDGDESTEPEDWVRGEMTPSPDGRYLLVRILVLNLRDSTRSAVVLLVDLPGFRVVWRRSTTDPLLANSQWRFIDAETLVAAEGPAPLLNGKDRTSLPSEVRYSSPVAAGSHRAALLSLPKLEERFECHYTVVVRSIGSIKTNFDEYSDDGVSGTMQRAGIQSTDCAELEKAAGVADVEDLPVVREMRGHMADADWSGCTLEDREEQHALALYDCHQGASDDGRRIQAEDQRVRAFDGDSRLLSVAVKPWEDNSSALASGVGKQYLVLLRSKLKVEVYLIR